MRARRMLLLASVLLVASAVAGVAQPQLGHSATPAKSITVSGHGTVTTVPDRASFYFTVETRAQTATGAIGRNGDAAAALAQAARNAGVAAADLQTSQLTLSPQTNEDGTQILGYVASTTVTAKTTIGKSGPLVDAAVKAGATGVSGPNLSRSDTDSLYRDALKAAVTAAHAKAAALAAAGGLTLGDVQSLVEGTAAGSPLPFASKADGAVAPIEPGTQTVEADVTVAYAAA